MCRAVSLQACPSRIATLSWTRAGSPAAEPIERDNAQPMVISNGSFIPDLFACIGDAFACICVRNLLLLYSQHQRVHALKFHPTDTSPLP
jgi:hypothetical protein